MSKLPNERDLNAEEESHEYFQEQAIKKLQLQVSGLATALNRATLKCEAYLKHIREVAPETIQAMHEKYPILDRESA